MNVSQACTLPFISVTIIPEHAPELPVIFLLDSGAAVNCLNAALVTSSSLRILPSKTCPVGASGALLENKGDIYATVKINSDHNYRDKFTLIEGLPFNGIIGAELLQNSNFQMLRDGNHVMLGNVKVPRVSGPGIIATIKDDTGKFLCGAEVLEYPLSGVQITNPNNLKMGTLQGTDHPGYGNSPNARSRKPTLSAICPIFDPGKEVIVRKNSRKEMIKAGHVGTPSAADLDPDLEPPNLKSLLEATHLNDQERRSLRDTLLAHCKAFSRHEDDLGCFVAQDGGPSTVNFEVRDPTVFVHSVPRRVPYQRREWLEEKLEAMIKTGVIEEVKYSEVPLQTSPIVIVPKKNGKFRMAVDYREVNANLKPSTVPLPNVKDCIECLAGKRYFSALDITSAFNQVKITEQSRNILGFVTLNRRFKTNRMPFGILSCPGEFQSIVSRTLCNIPKDKCTVYLDDILLHTETFEEHMILLGNVCTEIERHGLKLNPAKCNLVQPNIEYLGFIVGCLGSERYGYEPLPAKIRAIREYPLPTTPKEVRQFCGSLQYYNNLIHGLNIHLNTGCHK